MSETISPDTTIAQYPVISKIGEGGKGEVHRALRRFEQEAQFAGATNCISKKENKWH
jgi:hypothetical protein